MKKDYIMFFMSDNNNNTSKKEPMLNDRYRSISDLKKINGVFEIHPIGDKTVSGFIKSENGKLTDFSDGREYSDYDIASIEGFEEEGNVFYRKVM